MARSKNGARVSISFSIQEKEDLDRAAREAGMNRNKFLRWLIAKAAKEKG